MKTFTPEASEAIRAAICEAGGAEVFFVGRRGEGAVVAEVQVVARGHMTAVPAVLAAAHTGEVVIHNHPSGVLRPSEPDLAIAARASERGIGFLIVDNDGREAYIVVEPFQPRERKVVSPEDVADMLGPKGRLAKVLDGYEHRPQQMEMAKAVTRAFNRDRVLLVEAGTGTGKSMAYLLPAVLHARANGERVVVSTNTINLQEQLIGSDLPLLAARLGLEFKSVLLKGRSNYLCLRKADFARRTGQGLVEDAHAESLKSVLDWAAKTQGGTRSDLPFVPPDEVWDEVSSDADDCLRVKSPFHGQCFYFNSRREAATADVIVVNHHLLMADVAMRLETDNWTETAVLPPYTRVVLDEAHNLEDVASAYLATTVSRWGLLRTLGRLRGARDPGRGVLPALYTSLMNNDVLERAEAHDLAERIATELLPAHDLLVGAVLGRFEDIAQGVVGFHGLESLPMEELKLRLKPEVLTHPALAEGALPAARGLGEALMAYAGTLARWLEAADRAGAEDDNTLLSSLKRMVAVKGRLVAAAELLGSLGADDPAQCRWIEARARRAEPQVRIIAAPLDVSRLLGEGLFARVASLVLTSATLTVQDRFDHVAARLGLTREAERLDTARFASPFDFKNQALVVVPTDTADPQDVRFGDDVASLVDRAVRISHGRAFVLFTSYGLMGRIYRRLAPELLAFGLKPMKQGDEPRAALLDRFRVTPKAVLFAVQSFWEGVDVPGEALSLVILTRLPFKVPSEPIQEARVEAIARAGGDPFAEYAVPQAVIKFRQGFGRLIRTRRDRGVVLILDGRVVRKGYGRVFLGSLPEARVVVAPRERALAEIRAFFAKPR